MYYIKIKNTNKIIKAIDRFLSLEENMASILTFTLMQNSEHLEELERFITKLEVYYNQDKLFDGRIIDITETMRDDGSIYYKFTCESVLNYLNDTRVGKWDIHPEKQPEEEKEDNTSTIYENMTVRKLLELLLNNHNSKVKDDKKIYLGNVNINENVFCYTNRETSLNVIQTKLVDRKGGFLSLRESNNKYYLDYLKDTPYNDNTIDLGINLKSIDKENNLESIVTRLIPLGKDDITIKGVNAGKDYIEDQALINKYGIIESVHKWDDVTLPENLLSKAREKLREVNNSTYAISLSALDLSFIAQDYTEFKVSQYCTINNQVMNLRERHRIIAKDINLDEPFLSSLTLSNNPPSATNDSTSIRQEIDNTKIEIVITDKKLASKVANGEFTTYKEQTATHIASKVSSSTFESYKVQTASEIRQMVRKGDEFNSEVFQSAEKYKISMNGKLGGKTYTFDGASFKLGGTDSGNTAEHTNNYSKWIHASGQYSIADSSGFRKNNGAGERNIKSCDYMVVRPQIRNGRTETIVLPKDFQNMNINSDFIVIATYGNIDSDAEARFKKDAIRNIFVRIVSWNKSTRELVVQPCLQKIGTVTNTHFGWDSNTTTSGNAIGEGSIDVIIMAQI